MICIIVIEQYLYLNLQVLFYGGGEGRWACVERYFVEISMFTFLMSSLFVR